MPFFYWRKFQGKYYPEKSEDNPRESKERKLGTYHYVQRITSEVFKQPLSLLVQQFKIPEEKDE